MIMYYVVLELNRTCDGVTYLLDVYIAWNAEVTVCTPASIRNIR